MSKLQARPCRPQQRTFARHGFRIIPACLRGERCCGQNGRARAPVKAYTQRGGSPRQAERLPACNRRLLRRGDTGWRATGSERIVRRKAAQLRVATQTRYGLMRLTRLLGMCEVRRTAGSNPMRTGGQACPEQKVLPEDGGAWGGWRRNVQKCKLMNQGYLSRCWMERGRSQSPHRVAMKRVTTVEPRRAGRWKREGNTNANAPAGSAES